MISHYPLQSLSREHHPAIALTQDCRRAANSGNEERIREISNRVVRDFDTNLAPHFHKEETTLLPLLQQASQTALVNVLVRRTLEEHASLSALVESLRRHDLAKLKAFGQALSDHIFFEELELFPTAELIVPHNLLETAMRSSTGFGKPAGGEQFF